MLVANQEVRETSLCPAHLDAHPSSLTDQQYPILEVVGRARHQGVPRPLLTSYFSLDARSTFHFVKVMKVAGFLSIQVRRVGGV